MHTKPEYARLVKALHEAQDKIYIEEHLDSAPFLGNMGKRKSTRWIQ